MKVTKKYYRVKPSDIVFIRYILEAHDGLAVISTLPEAKDTIVLRIAPGCEEDVLQIVSGLKNEISMEALDMDIDDIRMDDKKIKDKL